jgi:predicted anti-sigma-YlaC factor YlaD
MAMYPEEPSAVVEMHCRAVRRVMVEYLDGDVDLETFVRVDAHLEHCNHCSAIFDGVRNIVALLGSEEAFQLPAGLSGRLYERLMGSQG